MTFKYSPLLICFSFLLSPMARSEEKGVVQPHQMRLKDRFEVAALGGFDAADEYIWEAGVSAQLVYHLRENFSLALNGSYLFAQGDSKITTELRNLRNSDGDLVTAPDGKRVVFIGGRVNYYRKPWLASAEVQWSPVYGRMSLHGWDGIFQLYVSVGAGATGLEMRDVNNQNVVVPIPSTITFAAIMGAGLRIYLGEHFGLRIQVNDYVSPLVARSDLQFELPPGIAPAPSSFLVSHSPLVQAGASFLF